MAERRRHLLDVREMDPLVSDALEVKLDLLHRQLGQRGGGQRRRTVELVGVAREEGRVALDLDQVEPPRGVDDLVEHASRRRLGVPEDAAVKLHVLRVAADVRYQEQRTPNRHGRTVQGTIGPGQAVRPGVSGCPCGRSIAAGTMIALIAIMILFACLQQFFVKGVGEGAVKG